jgi:hypothetical protein
VIKLREPQLALVQQTKSQTNGNPLRRLPAWVPLPETTPVLFKRLVLPAHRLLRSWDIDQLYFPLLYQSIVKEFFSDLSIIEFTVFCFNLSRANDSNKIITFFKKKVVRGV